MIFSLKKNTTTVIVIVIIIVIIDCLQLASTELI